MLDIPKTHAPWTWTYSKAQGPGKDCLQEPGQKLLSRGPADLGSKRNEDRGLPDPQDRPKQGASPLMQWLTTAT